MGPCISSSKSPTSKPQSLNIPSNLQSSPPILSNPNNSSLSHPSSQPYEKQLKIVNNTNPTNFLQKMEQKEREKDPKKQEQIKTTNVPQMIEHKESEMTSKPKEQSDSMKDFLKFIETLKALAGASEGHHMGITCGFCEEKNFKGYRYKCLHCHNYDLCDLCFEKKRSSKAHSSSHPTLLLQDPTLTSKLEALVTIGLEKVNEICVQKNVVHQGIQCNSCRKEHVTGIRFVCDECLNYNLCFHCFDLKKQTEKHLMSHPMVAFLSPLNYVIPYAEIELGEKLGEGSFGKAFKGKWRGRTIACKVLDFSLLEERDEEDKKFLEQQILSFKNESKIYKELCSQHIVKYIGESQFQDVKINTLGESKTFATKMVICLEFMENKTVKDKIIREKVDLSLRKRFQLCLGLSSGLRRIHSKKIIHKDLKPDNIFLSKDFELKIGDLGLAYNKSIANDLIELKQELYYPPTEKMSQASDIYSTGLIINEIFTGKRHKTETFYDVEPKSAYFFDVVGRCLVKNPENRPLAEQIENRFLMFDEFFWKFIRTNKTVYKKNMENEGKNKVFDEIYKTFIGTYGEF